MQLSIATNARALEGLFGDITARQFPFATAKALTNCARLGVADVKSQLGNHFTIRSKRTEKGFSIKHAQKSDWPNPRAEVGHKDDFLILHAYGGEKRSKKAGENVAIPTRLVHTQRTSSGTIPRALKPTTILDQKKTGAFKIPSVRIGRVLKAEKSATGRAETLNFYLLRPTTKIKATWPFNDQVSKSFDVNYQDQFDLELKAAIKSARANTDRFTSEQGKTFYLKALKSLSQ